jgi:hypothetical protein
MKRLALISLSGLLAINAMAQNQLDDGLQKSSIVAGSNAKVTGGLVDETRNQTLQNLIFIEMLNESQSVVMDQKFQDLLAPNGVLETLGYYGVEGLISTATASTGGYAGALMGTIAQASIHDRYGIDGFFENQVLEAFVGAGFVLASSSAVVYLRSDSIESGVQLQTQASEAATPIAAAASQIYGLSFEKQVQLRNEIIKDLVKTGRSNVLQALLRSSLILKEEGQAAQNIFSLAASEAKKIDDSPLLKNPIEALRLSLIILKQTKNLAHGDLLARIEASIENSNRILLKSSLLGGQ